MLMPWIKHVGKATVGRQIGPQANVYGTRISGDFQPEAACRHKRVAHIPCKCRFAMSVSMIVSGPFRFRPCPRGCVLKHAMATLIINCDGLAPKRVELSPGAYSVGADAVNWIVIEHPTVSRHHCDVVIGENGEVFVRDAGSTNGTWVANESVSDAVLAPGQSFRVGVAAISIEMTPGMPFVPHLPKSIPSAAATRTHTSPEHVEADLPRTFFQEFPDACRYPLRGDAVVYIFLVLFLEVVQAVLPSFLGLVNLVMTVVIGCYLVLLWQQIVHSTIDGKDRLPEMPFTGINWDENVLLYLRYIVLIFFCFSPVMLFYISAAMNENIPGVLIYLCYGISCLYFPMAILAFLITDSLAVLSPVFIVRSIFRKFPDYLFLAGLLALGIAADSLSSLLFEPLTGMDQSLRSKFYLWIVNLLCEGVGLYLFFVWMRLVGLFYRHNKDLLAWS